MSKFSQWQKLFFLTIITILTLILIIFSEHLLRDKTIIAVSSQNTINLSHTVLAQNTKEKTPKSIPQTVPEWARMVDITTINPNIVLDIRYATTNNFLGKQLYKVPKCALRKEVAIKLSKVQKELEEIGLGLKVFDCYRPLSVTKQMWAILPDSRYVANPANGSRHNRGAAVDVTLIDFNTKKELEMPTAFDDFSERAARDYPGNSPQVKRNSDLLAFKMQKYGFSSLITEWWHFDSVGWERFSILDIPLEKI